VVVMMVMVVMLLLLWLKLVTSYNSWLRAQILVYKQFFQGSDHIWRWQ
jgi:hypothetical protein